MPIPGPWAHGLTIRFLSLKASATDWAASDLGLDWNAMQYREGKKVAPTARNVYDPSLNCQHNVSIWQTKANNKKLFPSTPRTRGTKPWTKELFVSSSVFFTHHFKAQGYLHTISLRNICQLYCLIWSAGLLCSQWAYQSLPFLVFLGTAIISSGEVAISFPRFAGGKEVLIP
jgi:hypothetical protein